jgi:hypothetical protein
VEQTVSGCRRAQYPKGDLSVPVLTCQAGPQADQGLSWFPGRGPLRKQVTPVRGLRRGLTGPPARSFNRASEDRTRSTFLVVISGWLDNIRTGVSSFTAAWARLELLSPGSMMSMRARLNFDPLSVSTAAMPS